MSVASNIATARRLIAKNGEPVTYTKVTPGAIAANPTQGRVQTAANHAITAFPFDYALREIDGTLVRRGDRQLLLVSADLPVEPATGDRVTVDGVVYDVMAVTPTRRAGVDIIHTLQLRSR